MTNGDTADTTTMDFMHVILFREVVKARNEFRGSLKGSQVKSHIGYWIAFAQKVHFLDFDHDDAVDSY